MKFICKECEKGLTDDARYIKTRSLSIPQQLAKANDEINVLKQKVKEYEEKIRNINQTNASISTANNTIDLRFQKLEQSIEKIASAGEKQSKLFEKPIKIDRIPTIASDANHTLSFAEVLQGQSSKPAITRNVRITTDNPEVTMNKIRAEENFKHVHINRIKTIGARNITIEFGSIEHANKFDEDFNKNIKTRPNRFCQKVTNRFSS